MKSSNKNLFVGKESSKYRENPFRRIAFVHMHNLGLQSIWFRKCLEYMRVSIVNIKENDCS